jgi:cobyrinic acid a,c-diamide synthase
LVIAGSASGVGKTSLALGLTRALSRQGLQVQTFKAGPDFLDPTYLRLASGRTCHNLDGWMTSQRYVRELFASATADSDVAIVEGVMGLFDGASPAALDGSTAELAAWLDAPVILVANAHGAARSLAALVHGFAGFEPSVRVAGVIANQGGSVRHRAWLSEALSSRSLPPLVGMVPRGALPALPSRHLGLVTADQAGLSPAFLDQLADACLQHLDTDLLMELAHSAGEVEIEPPGVRLAVATRTIRLGIARDEAFHFYYPDNLAMLQRGGVQLVPFSPLAENQLPENVDALYLGGGYPELYAERLANNAAMLAAVRQFAHGGGCIYAECGGLMYLGRSLTTPEGCRYPLTGVLPIDTAMRKSARMLAYAEAILAVDSLWGRAGQVYRGHEFHYSEITEDDTRSDGWQPAYRVRRRGAELAAEGFAKGRILASYVHLHWASRAEAMDEFSGWFGG